MAAVTRYDAIVIGTGQSGPSLTGRMSAEGWKVAVIERKLLGGTCVNTGCIPTKTLVASARAAHMARRAADFGVMIDGPILVDMERVRVRKDEISDQSREGLARWIERMKSVTLYKGHARFKGPNQVKVKGDLLEADRIFINVGGRAAVPPLPGFDQVDYLTNASVMELKRLPEHLIIIGGSYIGLEFGQIFRRFGSRVTIIEKGPRLISRDDEDVSEAVKQILENEGVRIRTGAECIRAERRGDRIAVGGECSAGEPEVEGSHLLLAMGRVPNTDYLGLEKAGVKVDQRGFIRVDDQLRTSVPGVWAMGDCNGRGAFTHTSYNDFEIVAANLFDNDPRKVSDRILCYGLFIDPPLGRVGMTEAEARASGRRVLIGKRPMTQVGRARERSETDGFIKVLVDADSKEILGAAILGIEGDEVVQGILDVMYARAPYTVIQRAVHIHPTVAELVPTVLGNLKPLEAGAAAAR
jgi:pyruvate/2-oxoglutarate dehydrogenase complex dihydrolipoamide dehydrogenase (E3) component